MHNNLRNIKIKPKPGTVSEFGQTEEKDKRAKITSAETLPAPIQCHRQSLREDSVKNQTGHAQD